jgi:DNA polymerase-3 subunit epsilon
MFEPLWRSICSRFDLPVLRANDQELFRRMKSVLAELDKASGGKTVWRAVTA